MERDLERAEFENLVAELYEPEFSEALFELAETGIAAVGKVISLGWLFNKRTDLRGRAGRRS